MMLSTYALSEPESLTYVGSQDYLCGRKFNSCGEGLLSSSDELLSELQPEQVQPREFKMAEASGGLLIPGRCGSTRALIGSRREAVALQQHAGLCRYIHPR
jgi:hypothetical protein